MNTTRITRGAAASLLALTGAAGLGLGALQTGTAGATAPTRATAAAVAGTRLPAVTSANLPSLRNVWINRPGDVKIDATAHSAFGLNTMVLCGRGADALHPTSAWTRTYGSYGTGAAAYATVMSFRTPAAASAARTTIVGWYSHCENGRSGRGFGLRVSPSVKAKVTPIAAVGLRAARNAYGGEVDSEDVTVVQAGNRLGVVMVSTSWPHDCSLAAASTRCGVFAQSAAYSIALVR